MNYKIQDRSDYSKELICYEAKVRIRYYSKRQMKDLYPNGNFRILGEIGNKTGIQCIATQNLDGQPLPVYKEKSHNSLTEVIAGYAAVDSHTYLAVVKNDLPRRLVVLTLVLALAAVCAAVILGLNPH